MLKFRKDLAEDPGVLTSYFDIIVSVSDQGS